MRWLYRFIPLILVAVLLAAPPPRNAAAHDSPELVVGVSECEPFVIKNNSTEFSGLSIELFKQVADQLEMDYRFKEYDWDSLQPAVKNGEVDIAVTCLTITSDREEGVDFTQAYFQTNVTAATRQPNPFLSLVSILFSKEILLLIFLLIFGSSLVGILIWLLEHEANPEIYPLRSPLGRSVDVFLSGAIFIISGGTDYHVYKTVSGRVIAVVGKIINTIFLTGMTAIVVSVLSTSLMHGQITDPRDLYHVRVGVIPDTSAEDYLIENHISFSAYETDEQMLTDLEDGKIDAALEDEPLLRYLLINGKQEGNYHDLLVQGWTLKPEMYGFAIPTNSPIREEFNKALLITMEDPDWQHLQNSYFQQ